MVWCGIVWNFCLRGGRFENWGFGAGMGWGVRSGGVVEVVRMGMGRVGLCGGLERDSKGGRKEERGREGLEMVRVV